MVAVAEVELRREDEEGSARSNACSGCCDRLEGESLIVERIEAARAWNLTSLKGATFSAFELLLHEEVIREASIVARMQVGGVESILVTVACSRDS